MQECKNGFSIRTESRLQNEVRTTAVESYRTSKHVCYVIKCRFQESFSSIYSSQVKLISINWFLRYNNAIFVTDVKFELCVTINFNKASLLETLD